MVAVPNARSAIAWSVVLLAAYAVVFAVRLLCARLAFDGVLEHTEAVTHYLAAIRRDQPLYVVGTTDSSLRATSVIYHPLYYWYLRTFPLEWIDDFSSLRMLSVIPPVLLSAALIEAASHRAFGLRLVGAVWLIAGLAVFPLHFWMDLARPEAAFLAGIAFVYWSLCLAESRFKHVSLGIAIAVTSGIKQPGLLLLLVPAAMAFYDRRYVISLVVGVLTSAACVAGLYAWYGDSYLLWAFQRPGGHPYSFQQSWAVLVEYARSIAVCLVVPVFLPVLAWVKDKRRFEPALALLYLSVSVFGMAFIPAGKLGGWIGNFSVMTWTACIPVSVVLVAAMGRRGLSVPAGAGIAVLLALLPPLIEQARAEHVRNALPGLGDIEIRQLLMRISKETEGDVWTTTWPMIDQRAGRVPRFPVQQSCTVASHCTEFAPPLQPLEAAGPGWDVVEEGQIDVVITPDNLEVLPLTSLLERRYVECANLRAHFDLHHLFGQSYLPVQIWTSKRTTCQALRERFGL